jgi:UDP-N-acetylglucosamine:LPS N-acetylglucosamine transferase
VEKPLAARAGARCGSALRDTFISHGSRSNQKGRNPATLLRNIRARSTALQVLRLRRPDILIRYHSRPVGPIFAAEEAGRKSVSSRKRGTVVSGAMGR